MKNISLQISEFLGCFVVFLIAQQSEAHHATSLTLSHSVREEELSVLIRFSEVMPQVLCHFGEIS